LDQTEVDIRLDWHGKFLPLHQPLLYKHSKEMGKKKEEKKKK